MVHRPLSMVMFCAGGVIIHNLISTKIEPPFDSAQGPVLLIQNLPKRSNGRLRPFDLFGPITTWTRSLSKVEGFSPEADLPKREKCFGKLSMTNAVKQRQKISSAETSA